MADPGLLEYAPCTQVVQLLAELDGACLPAGHWSHAVPLAVGRNHPGAQSEHTVADRISVKDPLEHIPHAVDASAPENPPGSHCTQALDCGDSENVPALQTWHDEAPVIPLYSPAAHVAQLLEAEEFA